MATPPKGDKTAPKKKKYFGISNDLSKQRFRAEIYANGKRIHIGYFDDEIKAAMQYDEYAIRMGRPVNFPQNYAGINPSDLPPIAMKEGVRRKARRKQQPTAPVAETANQDHVAIYHQFRRQTFKPGQPHLAPNLNFMSNRNAPSLSSLTSHTHILPSQSFPTAQSKPSSNPLPPPTSSNYSTTLAPQISSSSSSSAIGNTTLSEPPVETSPTEDPTSNEQQERDKTHSSNSSTGSLSPPPSESSSSTESTSANGSVKEGRWTTKEHELFLKGLDLYDKKWNEISKFVGTRSVLQVRSHAQKYFLKMETRPSPFSFPDNNMPPEHQPPPPHHRHHHHHHHHQDFAVYDGQGGMPYPPSYMQFEGGNMNDIRGGPEIDPFMLHDIQLHQAGMQIGSALPSSSSSGAHRGGPQGMYPFDPLFNHHMYPPPWFNGNGGDGMHQNHNHHMNHHLHNHKMNMNGGHFPPPQSYLPNGQPIMGATGINIRENSKASMRRNEAAAAISGLSSTTNGMDGDDFRRGRDGREASYPSSKQFATRSRNVVESGVDSDVDSEGGFGSDCSFSKLLPGFEEVLSCLENDALPTPLVSTTPHQAPNVPSPPSSNQQQLSSLASSSSSTAQSSNPPASYDIRVSSKGSFSSVGSSGSIGDDRVSDSVKDGTSNSLDRERAERGTTSSTFSKRSRPETDAYGEASEKTAAFGDKRSKSGNDSDVSQPQDQDNDQDNETDEVPSFMRSRNWVGSSPPPPPLPPPLPKQK